MGAAEAEYRKQQILRMSPPELLKVIVEKFDLGHNKQNFENDMFEGLYAAVSERPAIAAEICPQLVTSEELRLVKIFLDLIADLWKYDEPLMLRLLQRAKQIKNEDVQFLIEDRLELYKEGALTDIVGFAEFLKNKKL